MTKVCHPGLVEGPQSLPVGTYSPLEATGLTGSYFTAHIRDKLIEHKQ